MIALDMRAELLRRAMAVEPVRVHLYTNNYMPSRSVPPSREVLTEASGQEYEPRVILPVQWSTLDAALVAPPVHWRFAGRLGRVYGYFVTGSESLSLYWAERFVDGPYMIEVADDNITVDPRIEWVDAA